MTDAKPHDMRVTVRMLRTGQPRPYADSETHTRITAEIVNYGSTEYAPYPITEAQARAAAQALPCGYVAMEKRDEARHWSDAYLDRFTPMQPERRDSFGVENEKATLRSAVWEFVTVRPYCD